MNVLLLCVCVAADGSRSLQRFEQIPQPTPKQACDLNSPIPLHLPIANSTFDFSIPPFGGYPGNQEPQAMNRWSALVFRPVFTTFARMRSFLKERVFKGGVIHP